MQNGLDSVLLSDFNVSCVLYSVFNCLYLPFCSFFSFCLLWKVIVQKYYFFWTTWNALINQSWSILFLYCFLKSPLWLFYRFDCLLHFVYVTVMIIYTWKFSTAVISQVFGSDRLTGCSDMKLCLLWLILLLRLKTTTTNQPHNRIEKKALVFIALVWVWKNKCIYMTFWARRLF